MSSDCSKFAFLFIVVNLWGTLVTWYILFLVVSQYFKSEHFTPFPSKEPRPAIAQGETAPGFQTRCSKRKELKKETKIS